jgi:hypothetical protein
VSCVNGPLSLLTTLSERSTIQLSTPRKQDAKKSAYFLYAIRSVLLTVWSFSLSRARGSRMRWAGGGAEQHENIAF